MRREKYVAWNWAAENFLEFFPGSLVAIDPPPRSPAAPSPQTTFPTSFVSNHLRLLEPSLKTACERRVRGVGAVSVVVGRSQALG
jgi:hypothetical protein